ncbi:MAG: M14 family metallopeptidase [Alphaproteobacteria bacterium]|nr:M14 family metallopeptidase [Alphaproteobacteria bacterium]MDE2109673.1 M14 family metallopeptidase [Alphaproteobacteria bacterium]MDE2492373.1 M14 family metallopeptidase [Alphaproteobacteria bacterium]
MITEPSAYFPTGYRSARSAFLKACAAAGLRGIARAHPSAAARDGKPLFLDTATIGPRDAGSALLLISGTHGVEGYFGSGVQTGLLHEGLARRVPKTAKVILLHALNPYGFSWDRRVNEDNADINRNFVDHASPPVNKAYEALADAIAPKDISDDALTAANAKLRAYSETHGAFALQEAISRGQYDFPDGLYFGGRRPSWSARMLYDIFRDELAQVKKLMVIDFHTGLGIHGEGEMISEDLPGSAPYLRAKRLWGARVKSSEAGESVSAPLTGTIDKAFATWMRTGELTFAALEMGTVAAREVFLALRKDNWLHRIAGAAHSAATSIRREIRGAFYPDSRDWRRKAWAAAHEVVGAALEAL